MAFTQADGPVVRDRSHAAPIEDEWLAFQPADSDALLRGKPMTGWQHRDERFAQQAFNHQSVDLAGIAQKSKIDCAVEQVFNHFAGGHFHQAELYFAVVAPV